MKKEEVFRLIDRLERDHSLQEQEYMALLDNQETGAPYAAPKARAAADRIYGHDIYVRGLIEFSNYCSNDCYYCGIRAGNRSCVRYRLTPEQILNCCGLGWQLGYRTFVLQSGEDAWFTDERLCALIQEIKRHSPDCALTLSIGEKSRESYAACRQAGADRYLIRHETASPAHYARLHPARQTLQARLRCIRDLRELGYAVGIGMMVGSPWQTTKDLAMDLKLIEDFQPEMCGIGPFLPHHQTPFAGFPRGSTEQTLYLLSLIRLICPHVLLPATTALGTADPFGREKGVLAGANVIMPNLSPVGVRRQYELYDGKICTGEESAQCRGCQEERMRSIGYRVVTDRGDPR